MSSSCCSPYHLSNTLVSIDVKGRLEHAISGEEIARWCTMNDLECYIDVDMGDYVVYNDWVGQVRYYSL